MSSGRLTRRRVWILVKAYPQPSKQYFETVCCAGIAEDTGEFLRLYPVRYRALPPESRFGRFDLVEVELFGASSDPRPESFKVVEDSIRIVRRGSQVNRRSKVRLWQPHVAESYAALKEEQKTTGKSLGIVRPDPGSMRFIAKPLAQASEEEREATESMLSQQSLLEEAPKRLPPPEYVFSYRFTSDGSRHTMQIHDWEVQAAWHNYKGRYGDEALDRLKQVYQEKLPSENLHLLMGTKANRPWQFMVIGLLHTTEDLDAQADLPL